MALANQICCELVGLSAVHYDDIIWVWMHLISLATLKFAQKVSHDNNKETIKIVDYLPFVVKPPHQPVVPCTKGQ